MGGCAARDTCISNTLGLAAVILWPVIIASAICGILQLVAAIMACKARGAIQAEGK